MNRSCRRRFGAALVLSLATLSFSLPCAVAADRKLPEDAARELPADVAEKSPADAPGKPPIDPAKLAVPTADPATQRLRHGARSKATDGSLLVWDNVTGAFVSLDRPSTYWVAERFYQYKDGVWLSSGALVGPWQVVAQHMVPEVARVRHGVPKESVTTRLPSGREAVYEPPLKVFRIAGRKGVFLFDATFYRYDNGVWLESSSEEGPWAAASAKRLPGTLRRGVPLPEAGTKVTLPSGEALVSEGEAGLFAVEGKPDAVYFDGWFYQRRESQWFVSNKSASGFEEMATNKVPAAVRSNYHKGKGSGAKAGRADKEKAANKSRAAAKDEAATKKKRADKDNATSKPTVAEPQ